MPWAEAAKASQILIERGFPAARLRVLHEGIPGWIDAGYPVVEGGEPPCRQRHWDDACYGQ